ncbi:hypothetical protein C0Q70_19053 [Pomacea canaliculata]|uniref:Tsg C-terminal domain-containing protein n=1 Tax=Pomacea canaliculata TaxID=400727 RepID=A0A2T7NI86_POMCA|nr:hypothetical protein C0Q70_19053 [Pomacea canaliculata]
MSRSSYPYTFGVFPTILEWLCPPPDPDDGMYQTSSIENLPDPIPDLFAVLTEEEDAQKRWTTHTYSFNLDNLLFKPGTGHTTELETAYIDKGTTGENTEQPASTIDPATGVMGIHNCTVAFFSQCMSIRKCKTSCKSMGAAKYRWFHEAGCCQCIGSTCIDFGLNEPRCLNCPPGVHTEVDLENTDTHLIYDDFTENGNSVEIEDNSENLKSQAGIASVSDHV